MVEIGPLFFPVRHYSPAAAEFVSKALREEAFDAVLIEGPWDFTPRMEDLYLGHKLPLAIYSFVIGSGGRRGAFYPFAEFSPEWQAILGAKEKGIPARFIDLPWRFLAPISSREHRYSDANFRGNPYVETLCAKLQVQEFDELWDVLFELPEIQGWREYVERARALCDGMRASEEGDAGLENEIREAFMAARIREAAEEFGPRLLIVTGGYHCAGLEALLRQESIASWEDLITESFDNEESFEEEEQEEDFEKEEQAEKQESQPWETWGVELTPFTYGRLDRLSGYAAGLQGPALYEALFDSRRRGEPFEVGELVSSILGELRTRGQGISTADRLAMESTARALAAMRGRPQVWRYELLDAMSATLVKEAQESEYAHPYLMVAREVMTGARRGVVDPAAGAPPLVAEVMALLEDLDLDPGALKEGEVRTLELELQDEKERQKSQILHRCAFLGVAGLYQTRGLDLSGSISVRRVREEWTLQWSPEYMASLIEASAYGTTLQEAVVVRALEWRSILEDQGNLARAAGEMVLEILLMGLDDLRQDFIASLKAAIEDDGDFFSLSLCLQRLVFLHEYDALLGGKESPVLTSLWEDILEVAFWRALWLFRSLGRAQGGGLQSLEAIAVLFEAASIAPMKDREEFLGRLAQTARRVARDEEREPIVRGAAAGMGLRLGESSREEVEARWREFFEPLDVGDYLTGVFRMAREAFLRERPFLLSFDRYISSLDEEDFLGALPALRMAFTFYTPREKLEICDLLFGCSGEVDDEERIADADRQEAAVLDRRILKLARDYGVSFETEDFQAPLTVQIQRDRPLPLTEFRRVRWRLLLGETSNESLGGLTGMAGRQDQHLDFLYGREVMPGQNIRRAKEKGDGERTGNLGTSAGLTVPEWINGVHELFPKRTIERLEEDALERYALDGIVTRVDVLERMEPSLALLKAVLRCKSLMNNEVLQAARKIVRKVVEELMKKWARDVESPFIGTRDPRRRSRRKIAKNFDARETIRRNLKHYDRSTGKLVLRQPWFMSRRRRFVDRWQVIVVVDQSGSMLDSVIHAAVTASIFASVEAIRSHLLAFDTRVVDLSDACGDPVETLMSVQLGGGTNIAGALEYAGRLVENPRRAIIVLITDFFEGGDPKHLYNATKEIIEGGVQILGLAALDSEAAPHYDQVVAQKMANLGAHVGAMTPGELAAWIAEKVR